VICSMCLSFCLDVEYATCRVAYLFGNMQYSKIFTLFPVFLEHW
jgi:hypothetical protein